jgi:hypothetical protein
MAQGPSLTPAPVPFSHYPKKENRRKKKQQVDCDQDRETDADHGEVALVGGAAGMATSLPHSIVTVVHLKSLESRSAGFFCGSKRERKR